MEGLLATEQAGPPLAVAGCKASKVSSGHSSAMEGKETAAAAENNRGGSPGGGGCKRASTTMFCAPGVCLMSEVNSPISDRCLSYLADQGGVVQNRAVTSGLWSVSRQNRHPNSRNLKWRMVLKAARSSLSKLDYCSPDSFLRKKARGCQEPP